MSEKRPLGALGPMLYSKLPRLVGSDPGPGPCPVGGAALSGAERLASWAPCGALYPASVAGASLPPDSLLASCLLYRPPTESVAKLTAAGPPDPLPPPSQLPPCPGPPLAAPKPVYRSPLCYGLSTCLGDGMAKRPLDVDWTLLTGPPGPPTHPPCSLAPDPGSGQCLSGPFLREAPGRGPGRDPSPSCPPCPAFLGQCQTGFPAPPYSRPYLGDSRQALPEGRPTPWTHLAQPLGLACQDSASTHCPVLTSAQALPCALPCHRPERQGSYGPGPPPSPGGYRGTSHPTSGLSSPYLQPPAAQSPCMPPGGLDTFSCTPATSPGLRPELPLTPSCPPDLAPPTLGFPYARDSLPSSGLSPGLGATLPAHGGLQAGPQPSGFPRVCQPLPPRQACRESACTEDSSTGSPEERPWLPSCREDWPVLDEPPRVSVLIQDSHGPCPRTSPGLPTCAQEEDDRSPHSPPMPVIDNVFSLAPYRHYLDAETPDTPMEPHLAPSAGQDEACEGALQPPCPPQEEGALDLSVRKPSADAPVQVSCPAELAQPPASGHTLDPETSDLPGLRAVAPKPSVLSTESPPRANFHSSVAFMFRKFKIVRPAPIADTPRHQAVSRPSAETCFGLAILGTPKVASARPLAPAPAAPSPKSPEQHFMGLHTSLCEAIAGAVAQSPPERLRSWLAEAGPWGRAAWREAQGVQVLLAQLLTQLVVFDCAHLCPFPHVVRAGAVFVPIHLVKVRLFPRLPPGSVERILQEHRVELRPTTLSEERVLRERALRGCTSRMLKLLALRQLPAIYPDLLGLQWHDCVRRQLGHDGPEEPTLGRREPESLAPECPAATARIGKSGKKESVLGSEKEVATEGGPLPVPATSSSPPAPALKARFRGLLEMAWRNGLALPTWGHRAPASDRTVPRPHLAT